MTPRPCKFPSPLGEGLGVRLGGRGGDSVFNPRTTSFIFFLNVTDPTPFPSPAGAGKHRIRNLLNAIPFAGSNLYSSFMLFNSQISVL